MNDSLPPFVYTKAFWEGLSISVAGLLALLAFFGVVDASWAVPSAAILSWVYGLLRMFGIEPELRAEALVKELENKLLVVERREAAVRTPTMKRK